MDATVTKTGIVFSKFLFPSLPYPSPHWADRGVRCRDIGVPRSHKSAQNQIRDETSSHPLTTGELLLSVQRCRKNKKPHTRRCEASLSNLLIRLNRSNNLNALAEGRGHCCKGRVHATAEDRDGPDDRSRNQRGQHRVFNGRGSFFFLHKTHELVNHSVSPYRAKMLCATPACPKIAGVGVSPWVTVSSLTRPSETRSDWQVR